MSEMHGGAKVPGSRLASSPFELLCTDNGTDGTGLHSGHGTQGGLQIWMGRMSPPPPFYLR